MVLRLSLYSSSLPSGTQTIPLHITVFWWYSEYPYTHHRLPRGTQTISILITVFLVVLILSLYSSQSLDGTQTTPILNTVSVVVLRLSLYTSQSPLWYSDYPFTHHSLSGCTQTIPILITIHLVAQTIPILITVSLVVL